jgi:hypothetical protein
MRKGRRASFLKIRKASSLRELPIPRKMIMENIKMRISKNKYFNIK